MTKSLDTNDNEQPAVTEPTYEVGYGKPPLHSRVQPGQVLNPHGRPKGQRNVATMLRKALNETTRVREGNRTRTMTKANALILKMINDAHSNPKVRANLIGLMRLAGLLGAPAEVPQQAPLTCNDDALIDDFFERDRVRRELLARSRPPATATKKSKPH